MPVIASVGHHTDRTLLDDVAAVSCSTPTHAAEAAVAIDCARARASRRAPRGATARARTARPCSRARGCSRPSRAPRRRTSSASARACTSSCARCAPARAGAWRASAGSRARRALVLERKAASALLDCRERRPRELEQLRSWRSRATTPSARSSAATRSCARADGRAARERRGRRTAGELALRFADGERRRAGGRAVSGERDRRRAAAERRAAHLRGRRCARRGDHPAPGLRRGEPPGDARAGRARARR